MATSAEKIAVGVLERDGIAAIWHLHLDAAMVYARGQSEDAEILLDIADAAEEIYRRHIWRTVAIPLS